MSKIFITFTAFLLAVAYHNIEALTEETFFFNSELFDTFQPSTNLTVQCNKAGRAETISCNQTVFFRWQKVYDEMIEAEKKNETHKYEQLKSELDCCEEWDIIGCVIPKIMAQCTPKDYIKIWTNIQDITEYFDKEYCHDYPYNERAEKCKPRL